MEEGVRKRVVVCHFPERKGTPTTNNQSTVPFLGTYIPKKEQVGSRCDTVYGIAIPHTVEKEATRRGASLPVWLLWHAVMESNRKTNILKRRLS